ncbi:growth arrest-specific protein 1 [Neodiprion lecontei]|uniref:Growth arrest-specific protein 1 n=1 Tax=Neodiprion lecontei TaxID=441921 RepID=A0A6J0BJZ5_NEOLC|nr:growth arrest-specific protein 1 [Neodiprion lecontei]XP_015515019.1 growth arrest-specific protein 1 [Neodiprion lecontei]XP_046592109.1 growth arrest-specific protein 1 [Neodiprion lecontei]
MFCGAGRLRTALVSLILLAVCTTSTSAVMRCEDARLRCAYRAGCGMALQHYVTRCSSVLGGAGGGCPETCLHALIALTSTDEGKELMTCNCARDDRLCEQSKQRVEVCRPSVMIEMNNTRVSCRIATSICNADTLCAKALEYYNGFCGSMFRGKKCTKRCRNSINILRRQDKAAKLITCVCDGAEDYDCTGIHRNMNWLCFGKIHHDYHDTKKILGDTRSNEILRTDAHSRGAGVATSIGQTSTALVLIFLLALLVR